MKNPLHISSSSPLQALMLGLLLAAGCGDTGGTTLDMDMGEVPDGFVPPSGCAEEDKVNGSCVGVSQGALCGSPFCTGGASCNRVIEVPDAAALAEALAQVQPGDCVALGEGEFGEITVPPDAVVTGRGAGVTMTGEITVPPTDELSVSPDAQPTATVIGLTVVGAGITVGERARVRIEDTLITGSPGNAITLAPDASLALARSTIQSAAVYGISAFEARAVDVETSLVKGVTGPGLWMQCSAACLAKGKSLLTARETLFSDNARLGVGIIGARATLETVTVRGTLPDPVSFEGGGGIGMGADAEVTATGIEASDNQSWGLLVDASSAELGGMGEGEGLDVMRNRMGIWVQSTLPTGEQKVRLVNAVFGENLGVAIGFSDSAGGITLESSSITDTQYAALQTLSGGVSGTNMVGDGINWESSATADLIDVTLAGNARQSIIIDGPVGAGSSITGATLERGDENKGIVAQRTDKSQAPTVTGSSHSLEISPEVIPVAQPPAKLQASATP